MSAFYALMDNLKEHLKTKNYIITKERTEKKIVVKIHCQEENINVKKNLIVLIFYF